MSTEKELLAIIAELLKRETDHECCGGCVDCTTSRQYEQSAARFNELQAFAAAESTKQFVQQQAATFAQLLSQQKP